MLDTVRNDFDVVPQCYSFINEIHFPWHIKDAIFPSEVQKLIAGVPIREIESSENQFIANIFLVP